MELPHLRLAVVAAASLVLVAGSGCQPDLAPPLAAGDGSGGQGGGANVAFAIVPDAPSDAAPLALRVRILAGGRVDPARVKLVKGDVGPGHLKQLAVDDPSNALEKRLLPAVAWSEGDDVVIAPLALLEPDERYAVAVPAVGEAFELRTAASPGALLRRAWPPADALSAVGVVVVCGDADLPAFALETSFAPALGAATIARGATASGVGHRCVRIAATGAVHRGDRLVPPPAIAVDGATWGIDPAPLVIGEGARPSSGALGCETGEVAFGPGCATVFDDRAIVRTPADPMFWAVGGADADVVVATAPGEPFAIHPLAIDAGVQLAVTAIDMRNVATTAAVATRTGPARAHVVLNEVLANAVGPEPASEWVELVNDGAVAASLAGFTLADLGGEVALPDVVLEPGALALLVGDDWTGDGLDDVAPPPHALILRVGRVGRSGIANGGEPLRLRDATGAIVSAIPAIAAPEPGTSTARREPWLADAPSSFGPATPTPGAPNGGAR